MSVKHPIVEHFAEEISGLVGNPNCKTCYGRFWTGIAELPDGRHVLNVCHCARVGESEYTRLLKHIADSEARIIGRIADVEAHFHDGLTNVRREITEAESRYVNASFWRRIGNAIAERISPHVRITGNDLALVVDRMAGYQPERSGAYSPNITSQPPQGGSGVPPPSPTNANPGTKLRSI